jgi:hypothetical protein
MSLREDLLDAIIAKNIGINGVVTRQEIINHFLHQYNASYTGSFLSNSEMTTGQHSPTYEKFTRRISRGRYEVNQQAIDERINNGTL